MEEKKKRPLTEKQKAAFEKRRRQGYEKWLKEKRKEISQRKKEEKKRKEKERLKKEKERLKKKKRPVGRPKKRGPKRKRKHIKKPLQKRGPKTLCQFSYKIISCCNGKQNKFIGKYRSSEEAYLVFEQLKKQDENVIFPISNTRTDGKIKNSINEYILIEKNDGENTLLRNEYGKLVEQKLNKEGWIIRDKFRYKIEEKFWVWGYNNRSERKTFIWIYENIVLENFNNYFDFKRVLVYKNKIVIKHDSGKVDIIFCKNESDAINFYNLLEDFLKKDNEEHKVDMIFACGPLPMLRALKAYAAENNIPCQVSLEERMGCGIGACLGCAVKVISGKEPRYGHVCKEGPVFNAADVEI